MFEKYGIISLSSYCSKNYNYNSLATFLWEVEDAYF